MTSTVFVPGTVVTKEWLNDANTIAYGIGQSSGSSLIGYGLTTVEHALDLVPTPEKYGAVGNGVTDDTAAFALFATAIKAAGGGRIPPKRYKVSQFIIDSANGLSIDWQGTLVGMSSGTYDAVCTIKNSADVSLIGRVGISGSWNTSYQCGLALYTDNATQCSNINIQGISISGAARAIRVGRSTEPNALCSEITISGGFTYGTPTVIEAWGTQTFVTVNNASLQSNDLGGVAPWVALDQYTIRAFGATVLVNGGEVGHNQRTKNACLCVEPITDPTYGNKYGNITVVGAAIEAASQLGVAKNSLSVVSPVAAFGQINIQACFGYHSGNLFSFIETASDFTGKIVVGGGTNFYSGPVRTQPNVLANGLAHLYVDDDSFGSNFVQGLHGLSGGIAHFSKREILRVQNCVGQALPAGTQTTLKFQSNISGTDRDRFTGNYSTSTGIFTVPAGGLKSVTVGVAYRTNQPTDIINTNIFGAGGFAAQLSTSMGGANNSGVISGSVDLVDQPAGSTIYVQATQAAIGAATNFGDFEHMVITAGN